jgi:hypothetical protein
MSEVQLRELDLEIKKSLAQMKSFVKWVIVISSVFFIGLIGSTAELRVRMANQEEFSSKINNDYLPFFVMRDIISSNNNVIEKLNALEAKDDARYDRAVQDGLQIQMTILNNLAGTKRGGGGSGGGGGQ